MPRVKSLCVTCGIVSDTDTGQKNWDKIESDTHN